MRQIQYHSSAMWWELHIFLLFLYAVATTASIDVGSVLQTSDGTTNVGFRIIHRDAPRSKLRGKPKLVPDKNPFKDVIQYVRARHARGQNLRHNIRRRRGAKKRVSGIQSPVLTLGQAGLEYYMPLQVGTPPVELPMIMDTGSDVSWIQCAPCKDCVSALRPPFNPRHSSSFIKLPCTDSTCASLYQGVEPLCSPSGRTCLFSIRYGDGSLSSGLMAVETITATTTHDGKGDTALTNITLGCADVDREGLPTGASGLLGLDRRPISFPSQLASRFGRKFSYCFPDRITHLNSSGIVFFGDSAAIPAHLRHTPLLHNPAVPSASLDYYYVGLLGVSVDSKRLPLSQRNFEIDRSTGSGGTIIDSGTTFTVLRRAAFLAMRRAFLNGVSSHLTRVDDAFGFTPCYNVSNGGGWESARVPPITLHFKDGVDVVLPKNNILIPVSGSDSHTTMCLAFQTNAAIPFNIIGNYQQQNLWIQYDVEKLQLGIAAAECAID